MLNVVIRGLIPFSLAFSSTFHSLSCFQISTPRITQDHRKRKLVKNKLHRQSSKALSESKFNEYSKYNSKRHTAFVHEFISLNSISCSITENCYLNLVLLIQYQ